MRGLAPIEGNVGFFPACCYLWARHFEYIAGFWTYVSRPGIKFYLFFNNDLFNACDARLEIKTEKIKIALHIRAGRMWSSWRWPGRKRRKEAAIIGKDYRAASSGSDNISGGMARSSLSVATLHFKLLTFLRSTFLYLCKLFRLLNSFVGSVFV